MAKRWVLYRIVGGVEWVEGVGYEVLGRGEVTRRIGTGWTGLPMPVWALRTIGAALCSTWVMFAFS
jgi:hypothetical protein